MMLEMNIYHVVPTHPYKELYVIANSLSAAEKYCDSISREIKEIKVIAYRVPIVDDKGNVLQNPPKT